MSDKNKMALRAEMQSAMDFLSKLGNVADTISSTDPDLKVAEGWNDLLDGVFQQIADFARDNGIEVE
jgi:hypothetical protein